MTEYSQHFIDSLNVADQLRRKYSPTFPVDVKKICDGVGIELSYATLSPKIDGFYFLSCGIPHICINNHKSKVPGRKLFTAAHELHHHIIVRQMSLTEAYYMSMAYDNGEDMLEKICSFGAAHLLMPEHVVRNIWREMRIYDPRNAINVITSVFGVTRPAAQLRVRELGLV